jgi:hypothetical protein
MLLFFKATTMHDVCVVYGSLLPLANPNRRAT